MKKIEFDDRWPASWQTSYAYDMREVYDDNSWPGYSYAYTNRCKHTLDLIKKVAPAKAEILDVAAAQGNYSLTLAELGYTVTWNDLREELVDYVKLKHETGIINFAPGNVFELEFATKFDVVLITEIIEHVAHPDHFLTKISHLVRPGGYVIKTTPNGEYFLNNLPRFSDCADPSQFESEQFKPNSDGHIFLLHLNEIEALAQQANFKVIENRLFTNPLTKWTFKGIFCFKNTAAIFSTICRGYHMSSAIGPTKKVVRGHGCLVSEECLTMHYGKMYLFTCCYEHIMPTLES
jgi:2-polyprenyl-6-hydroxyphenyl methylase/3-demethylubiquinone-9 3-methyltransferase